VDKVELVDVNPTYANIRYPDGRESTVSLQDLAPFAEPKNVVSSNTVQDEPINSHSPPTIDSVIEQVNEITPTQENEVTSEITSNDSASTFRRSSRIRKVPEKFNDFVV
jgi:hypothetical protein